MFYLSITAILLAITILIVIASILAVTNISLLLKGGKKRKKEETEEKEWEGWFDIPTFFRSQGRPHRPWERKKGFLTPLSPPKKVRYLGLPNPK